MVLNAREAMHLIELRSQPQGHESYRWVAREMHRQIAEVAGHRRDRRDDVLRRRRATRGRGAWRPSGARRRGGRGGERAAEGVERVAVRGGHRVQPRRAGRRPGARVGHRAGVARRLVRPRPGGPGAPLPRDHRRRRSRSSAPASADVVRTRMLLVDAADADAVSAVHGAVFGDVRPAATMVVVAALLDPRWRVEIEAEAVTARPAAARRYLGPVADPPRSERLGGMALANGLLVHGPRHWAAAVRDDDGRMIVASGRKRLLRAGPLTDLPLARGLRAPGRGLRRAAGGAPRAAPGALRDGGPPRRSPRPGRDGGRRPRAAAPALGAGPGGGRRRRRAGARRS